MERPNTPSYTTRPALPPEALPSHSQDATQTANDCLGDEAATHQLILFLFHGEAKHVTVQRVPLLIHWRLTPATWLVAKLGARWYRSIQSSNLHTSGTGQRSHSQCTCRPRILGLVVHMMNACEVQQCFRKAAICLCAAEQAP